MCLGDVRRLVERQAVNKLAGDEEGTAFGGTSSLQVYLREVVHRCCTDGALDDTCTIRRSLRPPMRLTAAGARHHRRLLAALCNCTTLDGTWLLSILLVGATRMKHAVKRLTFLPAGFSSLPLPTYLSAHISVCFVPRRQSS